MLLVQFNLINEQLTRANTSINSNKLIFLVILSINNIYKRLDECEIKVIVGRLLYLSVVVASMFSIQTSK